MTIKFKAVIGAVICLAMASTSAMAVNIPDAGYTFVFPILANWSAAYNGQAGDPIN